MKKLGFLLSLLLAFQSYAYQNKQEVKKVNGKDFIVYSVQSGDGWYAIARKFGISYAELRVANKDTDDKLFPGKKLLIPAKLNPNDPYFDPIYPDKVKNDKVKPVQETKYHTVVKSQTLFSISKMYNVSVDDIKSWNNLTSNSISVGEKLIVSKSNPEPKKTSEKIIEEVIPEPVQTTEVKTETIIPEKPVEKQEKTEEVKLNQAPVQKGTDEVIDPLQNTDDVENIVSENTSPPIKSNTKSIVPADDKIIFANGRHEVNETGKGMWMEEEEEGNTDKYVALHRTAPAGTVIRVLNMSNSRKIFVKVVGTLSDSEENEGLIIKISKAGAQKLDATENTFRVNLLYGMNGD